MKKIILMSAIIFSVNLTANSLVSQETSTTKAALINQNNWTTSLWFANKVTVSTNEDEDWKSTNGYIDFTQYTGKTGEQTLVNDYNNLFLKCSIIHDWGEAPYIDRQYNINTSLDIIKLTDEDHVPGIKDLSLIYNNTIKSGLAYTTAKVTFGGYYFTNKTNGHLSLRFFFGVYQQSSIFTTDATVTVDANFIKLQERN